MGSSTKGDSAADANVVALDKSHGMVVTLLLRIMHMIGWLLRWLVGWPLEQVARLVLQPLYDHMMSPLFRSVIKPAWNGAAPTIWRGVLRPVLVLLRDYVLKPVGYVFQQVGHAIKWTAIETGDVVTHTLRYLDRRFGAMLDRLWKYRLRPVLRALYHVVRPVLHATRVVLRAFFSLLRGIIKLTWRLLLMPLKFVWRIFCSPILTVLHRHYARRTRKGFKQGNYTLGVRPGKIIESKGENLVLMKDQQTYSVYLRNDARHPANCILSVDGVEVGRYRVEGQSYYYVERPAFNDKRFTFFLETTLPDQTGIKAGRSTNGLVEAKFVPARTRRRAPRRQRAMGGLAAAQRVTYDDCAVDETWECARKEKEEEAEGGGVAYAPGGTALTGTSTQSFRQARRLVVDEAETIAISLRLVGQP